MFAAVGSLLLIAIATAALPLPMARQATPLATASGIPPVVWELHSIASADETIPVADPAAYTVQFLPDGQLRLRADCNGGDGSYRLDGEGIEAGAFRTTRVACGPGSLEDEFLRMLEGARRWSFVGEGLRLDLPGDGGSLLFAPRLHGVVWEWQGFQGGNDREVVPAEPAAYWIEFLPDGRYVLQADCNTGGGRYEDEGAAIDLQLAVLTEAVCPDPALDREFLRVVEDASSFVFRDGDLYLALPADAGIARFAARPVDAGAVATPVGG